MTNAEIHDHLANMTKPEGNSNTSKFDLNSQNWPVKMRVEKWKSAVTKMDWGDDEHICELNLKEGLEVAKNLGLAFHTVISRTKGTTCVLGGFLVLKAIEATNGDDEEWKQKITEIAQEVGIAASDAASVNRFLPEVHYNAAIKDYWMKTSNVYTPYGVEMVSRKLVSLGHSPKKGDDGSLSEVDEALLYIAENKKVDAAGQFAGYMPGIYHIPGRIILAAKGYKLIQPVSPDDLVIPKHIPAILRGLFKESFPRFCAWLRAAYQDLSAERRNGGLCLVIVGPPNTCKTLCLQKIIVPTLGGRNGSAIQYMSQDTSFNDTLISSEVWSIDDGNPFDDYTARKAFTGMVKMAVSTEDVFCHPKGRVGFNLPLYRRMVVICNHDAMESAPEIYGSVRDKVLLLRGHEFAMPADCTPLPTRDGSDAWEKFSRIISDELPHFLRMILENQEIGSLVGGRFGTEAWHDPSLMAEMRDNSPLHQAALIITESCVPQGLGRPEMTATEIMAACANGPHKTEAARLFKYSNMLGTWLAKLTEDAIYKNKLSPPLIKRSERLIDYFHCCQFLVNGFGLHSLSQA